MGQTMKAMQGKANPGVVKPALEGQAGLMAAHRQFTPTESFEFFGVVPKNARWSWSGRSTDGSVVAVTIVARRL